MKIGARYILIILTIAVPLQLLAMAIINQQLDAVVKQMRASHLDAASRRVVASLQQRISEAAQYADIITARPNLPQKPPLTATQLDSLGFDILLLSDTPGNPRWSVFGSDVKNGSALPTDAVSAILMLPPQELPLSGLFRLGEHTAIASVRSVNYSSPQGPVSSRLVLVQVLDQGKLSKISDMSGVVVGMIGGISADPSDSNLNLPSSYRSTEDFVEQTQFIGGIIPGERFALRYKLALESDGIIRGLCLPLSLILFTCTSLLVIASFFVIDGLILRVIQAITRQIRDLVAHPDSSVIAPCHPKDPLGLLVSEINRTLDRFAHSQKTAAHATRLAKLAIDRKTDFLVSIRRAVRSPLNAILGIAQIMERMSLPIQLREYVDILKQEGNTILEFINDKVDYSSVESGRVILSSGPFNIQDLLTSVVESHALGAFRKNVEVIIDISATAPTHVEGDRLRISKILNTLVGNAVAFTDVAEVVVSLSGKSDERGVGTLMLISVKDSGIGIPPEQEPGIFDPLLNQDSASEQGLHQTGLNLPVARKLARAMGGELWLENDYGNGATFHLELVTTAASIKEDTALPLNVSSEVLVADFHPMSSANLCRTLRELGFFTVVEVTQDKLIDRLKTDPAEPLIIFTDIRILSDELLLRLQKLWSESLVSWYVIAPPDQTGELQGHFSQSAINVIPKPISRGKLTRYLCQSAPSPAHFSEDKTPSLPKGVKASNGLSILVVDDIQSNRFILETMLTSWGHQVTSASSGIEAVNILEERGHFGNNSTQTQFDLIFMDIQMPHISGLEATRIIRASEKLGAHKHPVPIIAVTADAETKNISEYVLVGMWGVITKPILGLRLFGIIESLGLRNEKAKIKQSSNRLITPEDAAFIASLERRDQNLSLSRLWNDLDQNIGDLMDILQSFLEETRRQLTELDTLLNQGSIEDISALAHALKGALLNIGALGCGQLASNLETAALQNNLPHMREIAGQFNQSATILLDTLRKAMESHKLGTRRSTLASLR